MNGGGVEPLVLATLTSALMKTWAIHDLVTKTNATLAQQVSIMTMPRHDVIKVHGLS